MRMEKCIEIQNLQKSFGAIHAVNNLSLQVETGQLFAFLGVNGAGKSTTISMICGQLRQDAGQIFVNGKNTLKDMNAIKRDIGVVFQNSVLDKQLSVQDNLKNRAALYGITGKAFQTRLFELDDLLELRPLLKQSVGKLSGGQRQRVAIARAVIMEPELLIADEPIASLDVSIQAQIVNLFRHLQEEHGFTFLFIAHDLSMVEYLCDRVGVMYHGKLVEVGLTEDVFAQPKHSYTKRLMEAIPIPEPGRKEERRA